MTKFIFHGVITKSGKAMTQRITLQTLAKSKAKARSNFKAQAKKLLNLGYGAGDIDIVGDITEEP